MPAPCRGGASPRRLPGKRGTRAAPRGRGAASTRVHTAAENTVTAWISGGSGPMTSMPGTCINSLNCWKPSSTSPRATSVPTGTPGGACTMRGAIVVGDAPALEQADEVRAARTRRIADAARAQHGVANRRFAADVGSRRAGGHRDRHARAREIDAAVRIDAAAGRQLLDRVGGQHDEIERFAVARCAAPRRRRRPTRSPPVVPIAARSRRASSASTWRIAIDEMPVMRVDVG